MTIKNYFTILISLFFSYTTYSQCVPDTLCVDTELPGQICPDSMPDGRVNESYYQTITIWAPATIDYEGSTISLSHLKLETISNMPQGLTWQSNAVNDLFQVGISYCIQIEGTPEIAGNYPLGIEVQPYVMSIPIPTTVVDDSSLSILIEPELSIYDGNKVDFSFDEPYPNPFENSSVIDIYSVKSGIVSFKVFDRFGRNVISEEKEVLSGQNKIEIDGENLNRGIYIYSASFENNIITGKIVKI